MSRGDDVAIGNQGAGAEPAVDLDEGHPGIQDLGLLPVDDPVSGGLRLIRHPAAFVLQSAAADV